MYHYTDGGLKNIWLINGYEEIDTPYGKAVSIEDIDGLHRVIGRWLVDLPKPLTGAEFRFIRHELDLSQKRLADMMGKTELTIGRWERALDRPVDPAADRLIRLIYTACTFYADGKPIRELIDRLAELDQVERAECRLEERQGKWRVKDPVLAA